MQTRSWNVLMLIRFLSCMIFSSILVSRRLREEAREYMGDAGWKEGKGGNNVLISEVKK